MGITIDLFHQLLSLEEIYYTGGGGNFEVLQVLIDLYAKCIEHYDSIQVNDDPVGFYFTEKLQNLFASKNALSTLRKCGDKASEIVKDDVKPVSQCNGNQQQHKIISAEVKKKERQMMAKITMEVQDQIDSTKDSLETMIQGYQRSQNMTKSVVISDLQKQEDKILERMRKRNESKRQLTFRQSGTSLSRNTLTESLVSSLEKLEPYQDTDIQHPVHPSYFQDLDSKKKEEPDDRNNHEQPPVQEFGSINQE